MKVLLRIASLMSLGLLLVPAPDLWSQNTNADYSGAPPFISATVTPNILLLLDNSGSMALRIACPNDPVCPGWDPNVSYSGLFDPEYCYTYSVSNIRFVRSGIQKVFSVSCADPTNEWNGNFLNWINARRLDSVKKAMIGGSCVGGRSANGSCPTSGTPALITVKAEDSDTDPGVVGDFSTSYLPDTVTMPLWPTDCPTWIACPDRGVLAADAAGHVPSAVIGTAVKLYFHLRGTGTLAGSFCVDDDMDAPIIASGNCDTNSAGAADGDAYSVSPTDRQFVIHLALAAGASSPVGVIQKVGAKARLGLIEFKESGDGGKVTVPIGGRQVVPVNSTAVTTVMNNTVAMVLAVEASRPLTYTPLAETLHTALRYIAQLPQPYDTTNYTYPLAFAPGVPYQAIGQGSIQGSGANELAYLSASEAVLCTGASLTDACARDPFFFASNKISPPATVPGPWLLPPAVVQCCKTFIILFTDGEPTDDDNIPLSIGSLAAPYSATLSTLDDVAYWGHKTDLRPEDSTDPACLSTPKTVPTIRINVDSIGELGRPLCGMQNANIYTFFAFGSGSAILQMTARMGGYIEQDGVPNGPDRQQEWDRVNADGTTGSTVIGCNADCIPDNYYEAQNADQMETQLLAVFTDIGSKVASGSAVGVLTSTATGEGALYQAYFFPSLTTGLSEVKWLGYLQSLWLDRFGNLREDHSAPACGGPPDAKLILDHDCIIRIRYDTTLNTVKVDRFVPGSPITVQTVDVADIQPIWEAGRRLALTTPGNTCAANSGGVNCRRILTWMDISNGGSVGPSVEEYNEFAPGRVGYLCPYLGGALAINCNSGSAGLKASALAEATKIINFIRGEAVPGLRNRTVPVLDDTQTSVNLVWKLGDIINSAPTVVGFPRERFDILYGDQYYSKFYQLYKDRRQVTYVGGNDGMLHAFNSGYFFMGDDPASTATEQALFNTEPKKLNGTGTALVTCSSLPCDGGALTYTPRTGALAPPLGAELWAFIPQDLLPQLRWLTSPSYDHVYFVDSKPKVTDVRIFCGDANSPASCINGQVTNHPGGWGTILIGGFRLGGSCSKCGLKGKPRTVTSDFDYDGATTGTGNGAVSQGSDTRVFLSSYFVLDITNPEIDPVLLWVFRDKDLGFTTAAPAVLRLNPIGDGRTQATNAKWYAVFGTGPTDHDGSSSQNGQFFVVDLAMGPKYTQINETAVLCDGAPCITANIGVADKSTRVFSTGLLGGFMGDALTTDINLDFRVDAVYVGSSQCAVATPAVTPSNNVSPCLATGPTWKGAMYRLTTSNGNPDPDTWGVANAPTVLVNTFTSKGTSPCIGNLCTMGPITAQAQVTSDDQHNIWVFFGSGRYFGNIDKSNADPQYFLGVVDCILTGSCAAGQSQSTPLDRFFDVSNVVVCDITLAGCAGSSQNVSLDGGASYSTGFDGLGGLVDTINTAPAGIRTYDGWFTTLPNLRERDLNPPVILAGTLFYTTYTPTDGICEASGTGKLYGMYYLTGTAYKTSGLGASTLNGVGILDRSISTGDGMPSAVSVHIGAQGSSGDGQVVNGTGCKSRTSVFVQKSTGAMGQTCVRGGSSGNPFSEMLTWRDL